MWGVPKLFTVMVVQPNNIFLDGNMKFGIESQLKGYENLFLPPDGKDRGLRCTKPRPPACVLPLGSSNHYDRTNLKTAESPKLETCMEDPQQQQWKQVYPGKHNALTSYSAPFCCIRFLFLLFALPRTNMEEKS